MTSPRRILFLCCWYNYSVKALDFLLLSSRDLLYCFTNHNREVASLDISWEMFCDFVLYLLCHSQILTIFFSFCRSSVGGGIGKNPFGAEQRAGGDSKRSTSRDWRPIARNWGKMNDLQRYTKDWSMNHFSDEKFHQPPKNFLDHAAIKIGLQTIDFIT